MFSHDSTWFRMFSSVFISFFLEEPEFAERIFMELELTLSCKASWWYELFFFHFLDSVGCRFNISFKGGLEFCRGRYYISNMFANSMLAEYEKTVISICWECEWRNAISQWNSTAMQVFKSRHNNRSLMVDCIFFSPSCWWDV